MIKIKNNKNFFKWKHFIYVKYVSKRENKYCADNLLSGIIIHFLYFTNLQIYNNKFTISSS